MSEPTPNCLLFRALPFLRTFNLQDTQTEETTCRGSFVTQITNCGILLSKGGNTPHLHQTADMRTTFLIEHMPYGGMNMDAIECIKTRRSVRKFTDQPVTEETVRELIELASYAPSWKNCQPIRYTAVFNPELKNRIADTCVMNFPGNKSIIDGCSVLLIPSIRHGRSGFERDGSFSTKKEDRWEVFDAGIATQTLTLAAEALGLGTVIMGIFDPDLVAEAVGLPDDQIVSALVGVGYPDQNTKMPPRKSVDDLLTVIK